MGLQFESKVIVRLPYTFSAMSTIVVRPSPKPRPGAAEALAHVLLDRTRLACRRARGRRAPLMGFRQRRIRRATAERPIGVRIREGGGTSGGFVGLDSRDQSDFIATNGGDPRPRQRKFRRLWPRRAEVCLWRIPCRRPGHGKAVISAWDPGRTRRLKRGSPCHLPGAAAGRRRSRDRRHSRRHSPRDRDQDDGHHPVHRTGQLRGSGVGWNLVVVAQAGSFARMLEPATGHVHATGEACGPDCGHLHMPGPELARSSTASMAAAVFAAGVRPCSGAIIVLVFALAQGVFAAGIAAAFAMANRHRAHDGALAALAVLFKAQALRLASVRGRPAHGCWRVRRCWPPHSCWRLAWRCSPGSGVPAPPADERASLNGWTMKVAPGPYSRSRAVNSVVATAAKPCRRQNGTDPYTATSDRLGTPSARASFASRSRCPTRPLCACAGSSARSWM